MLTHETLDRVRHLSLARPDKKNAFTAEMYHALTQALLDAEQDPGIHAIVLSGQGAAFSAGNDIADFVHHPPQDLQAPPLVFLRTLAGLDKPVVAAVQGLAVGIGATLLLHCDLVYAQDNTQFWFPFVGLGLVPEGAATLLLPQRLGHQRAAELLWLGEPLSAQEAQQMGWVNAVTTESALPLALAQAARLARLPTGAVRGTKRLLRSADKVCEHIDREGALFIERTRSAAAQEAFRAFLEKRPPQLEGLG